MAEKISLRDYQRELTQRLRGAERGSTTSKLGVRVGDENWLVYLADAGEVMPVPPITPVPLTRSWFKGVANIRGNLYSIVDFPGFLGGAAVALGDQARLLLIGERFHMSTGLLVDRSLGLRNPEHLQLRGRGGIGSSWLRAEYTDAEGGLWKELDVPQLLQHPDFLGVGA